MTAKTFRPRPGPRELARDEHETGFTAILRGLFDASPTVLAVVFVDNEGECVDHVSAVSSYDAKVLGAQVHILVHDLVREAVRRAHDSPYFVHITATRQEVAARRVDEDYLLVLAVAPGTISPALLDVLEETAHRLRSEAGLSVPSWDAFLDAVEVQLRPAVGWEFAPRSFRHRGRRIMVADVLGRWHEEPDEETTCFRVRTRDGAEVTLVYHPSRDIWTHRR